MKSSVLSVKFEDPDSGYGVVRYKLEEVKLMKNGKPLEAYTAVGYGLPTVKGCVYDIRGTWGYSQKYKAHQLKVQTFQEVLPTTEEGILAYLQSGVIKNIGPKTAALIVKKFGLDTFRVFDEAPEQLKTVKGISDRRYSEILASYQEHKGARELIAFLAPFGVTANKAIKVKRAFGGKALSILRTEPYRLCEIKGFGFLTVDAVARRLGIAYDDPARIREGVRFVLEEAAQNGDLYLPSDTLLEHAQRLLDTPDFGEHITDTQLFSALQSQVAAGVCVMDGRNIYLRPAYEAECGIAEELKRLRRNSCRKVTKLNEKIAVAAKQLKITLSAQQQAAIRSCFENPVTVITGGPGTGKTTIQKVILAILASESKGTAEALLCAPTGRAARRMAEASGYDAMTVHMALAHMGDLTGARQFTADLIIADELSMVDVQLAWELLKAIPRHARLVLVGDANQLPSVGPGRVLAELIHSKAVPVVALTDVYRQAEGSRIIENADKISRGLHALQYGEDFQLVQAEDSRQAAELLKQLYVTELAGHTLDDVQVLSPVRRRGELGVRQLNPVLRDMVNPPSEAKAEVVIGSRVFRTGDKVMQNTNAGDIANGDMGYVTGIKTDPETGAQLVVIDFGMGRVYEYGRDEMDNVELAFATTIHKSQGNEFAKVIIPVLKEHAFMLNRNLIYTAITRARTKVILIGSSRALHAAIGKHSAVERNTILADRIRAAVKAAAEKADKEEQIPKREEC